MMFLFIAPLIIKIIISKIKTIPKIAISKYNNGFIEAKTPPKVPITGAIACDVSNNGVGVIVFVQEEAETRAYFTAGGVYRGADAVPANRLNSLNSSATAGAKTTLG